MTLRVRIELSPKPLDRLDCEVAVAGFFSDERPLRGGAARADWRLCGQLSARIESGDLAGDCGEAMLIGASRALRSPRLMVIGLGARRDFDARRLRDQTEEAVRRCLGLRCFEFAMTPLGIAPDDVPRHAGAILLGIQAAIEDAARPVHLQLAIRRSEIPAVERAFATAIRGDAAAQTSDRAKEIELVAPRIEQEERAPRRRAGAPISRTAS